jgi:hypothetical protein
MGSAPKCLVVLALAALASAGAAPVLAQSVYSPDRAATDRGVAVPDRCAHPDDCPPDDNPKGQYDSYCPPDH